LPLDDHCNTRFHWSGYWLYWYLSASFLYYI